LEDLGGTRTTGWEPLIYCNAVFLLGPLVGITPTYAHPRSA